MRGVWEVGVFVKYPKKKKKKKKFDLRYEESIVVNLVIEEESLQFRLMELLQCGRGSVARASGKGMV